MVNIAELGIPYPQLVIETTDRFNRESPHIREKFPQRLHRGLVAAWRRIRKKKIITKYLKTADPEIIEATSSKLYAGHRLQRQSQYRRRAQRHRRSSPARFRRKSRRRPRIPSTPDF